LQPAHHRVATAGLRPPAAVDVETEDARDLRAHGRKRGLPVDLAVDTALAVLSEADADWLPPGVGQEGEGQGPTLGRPLLRWLVPGADELRALFQRERPERFELERGAECARRQIRSKAAWPPS